ncbi:MAG: PhzF family phenazine biosynthesis protein [Acidobacteriota bacterium]|nr:MAG: PhzF family phenazine biosynthesis protein [Acidobacteriota bacterium]
MKLPIYQVDAFTDQLFAGNPAAVVLLDRELPDKTLQQIAAENNLSETAFLLPGKEVYSLRWFTPALEVDLCGHATLASAFVLFQEKLTRGPEVRFETRSGVLKVRRDGDLMELDFPSRPPVRVEHSAELAAALGAEPLELYHAERDWMALMSSEREVRHLKPDFSRLGQIDCFAVAVTAAGEEVDFVSRFFAPRAGILEDPVTGSAHCTLTPFWSERLGKRRLQARQVSQRGGELVCEIRGDRVAICGRAVEYLRGQITI